ncbi:T-complex protein 11-like protein 2 isoform X1 [Microcaecilia unicolor]|uniref:T-complex protein 11-like protein 2 isoform X1 n=1 Tax=Microcaecilia unicolor TaxID=1415580 RepID=A0A6P7Z106_9AMPH|nr:T-complex protein 11-like protein 2 isoform X1 [Microcaecilia unicolor]XP_030070918.1 T-complex protein 11-like protein 2 isoform X1 [Microcaecilia unicolor]XP_030070919.1 T-complex protein 11-like protein 2 isoform X1 [Microcaecilia unicolor]XP_030070920.1 T-complex protein 11-like protein 2 isoform X1 [Microcaecilia unicolor]XP_030070921.1 T-complex protein 11-like protein 2 isoform X1 [Microcaecilia unicolor]XP_030070922.1 T-complex protein 11-like protein 2 isoform X1 [Microcaecilia uni
MPLSNEKNSVSEDLISDSDSSGLSESTASSSDYDSSRQSFTSDSSSKPSSPASSPPKSVTFDELMAAANDLSNMILAHEIVVNEKFHLEQIDLPEKSVESRVKEIVHKAFWDSLESELNEDPPEYEHAIKLFEEIKEILLSFLAPGANRLRNQICEVLDIDLIRQQADHSAVDICGLANYVVNTMGKLCAPVRDEDVKKLQTTGSIVQLLRDIFHVLDLMKMDMINYTIQNLRPHLQRQIVDYERTKFQEILDKTPNALSQTTEWIKESIEDILSTLPSPGTEQSSGSNLSPTQVLNNGYLKLLQGDYQTKALPETLMTDETRLQELKEKLNHVKVVACILLITHNTVGAATAGIPEFAEQLKTITTVLLDGMNKKKFDLKEALNTISIKMCFEINKFLTEKDYPTLTNETQASLMGQICSIGEEDNPVCNLIDKRVLLYMKSLLCLPSAQRNMPSMPGGLAPVQIEMESIGTQYANIVNFNKQVYGPFYANILRKLLFSETSGQGEAGPVTE